MKRLMYALLALAVLGLILSGCERVPTPPGEFDSNQNDLTSDEFEHLSMAKEGATKSEFHLSGEVQPTPPYGSRDVPGSGGKVISNQPNGKVEAIINTIVNGLKPNTLHQLYVMNYNNPGASGWTYNHRGPWTLMGTFMTDDEGHADFQMKIMKGDKSSGSYNLSVWINESGCTVLISDNFQIVID